MIVLTGENCIFKFIHVLIAIALLGSTAFCVVSKPSRQAFLQFQKTFLILSGFALLTGTELVLQSPIFTFQTPWIQVAYTFITLYFVCTLLLYVLHTKQWISERIARWLYAALVIILICIIHDAVMKTTFIHL